MKKVFDFIKEYSSKVFLFQASKPTVQEETKKIISKYHKTFKDLAVYDREGKVGN